MKTASSVFDWGPVTELAEILGRGSASARLDDVWSLWAEQCWTGEGRGSEPTAAPRVPEMATALAHCQQWLARRNVRFLLRFFGPYLDRFPSELVAVSPRAVTWAVKAFGLETKRSIPVTTVDEAVPLGSGDRLADLVSLHVLIESLVETSAGLLSPTPASEASEARRAGGFRRAGFLQWFPALVTSGRWRAAHRSRVVRRLSAASPLTRLIYFDLFHPEPPEPPLGAGASIVNGPRRALDRLRKRTPSEEPVAAPSAADGAEAGWLRSLLPGPLPAGKPDLVTDLWRDLWQAHLARSLVGALRSPPWLYETWASAEERRRRLEPAALRWAGRRKRPPEQHRRFRRAREAATRLRQDYLAQYPDKLAALAVQFRSGERSDPALEALHIRVLALLAQQLLDGAVRRLEGGPVDHGQIDALVDDAYEPLVELLFGMDRADLVRQRSAERWNRLRESALATLLDPAPPSVETARAAGLPAESVRSLLRRFEGALELPFPKPLHRGPRIGSVLGRWYGRIYADLTTAEEAVRDVT